MDNSRISSALERIESAMDRIAKARDTASNKSDDSANSKKIMALVNNHEKLREQVTETLNELDVLIEELEG